MTLAERTPSGPWTRYASPLPRGAAIASSLWTFGHIRVISALEDAEYPNGNGSGPQWHVSITHKGKRPTDRECKRALRAFGLYGAEEDNHHPGNARHFWRPVDPSRRVDCECKATEVVVRETDGYAWTNPTDGACRGCEIAPVVGRPCPIHGAGASP